MLTVKRIESRFLAEPGSLTADLGGLGLGAKPNITRRVRLVIALPGLRYHREDERSAASVAPGRWPPTGGMMSSVFSLSLYMSYIVI